MKKKIIVTTVLFSIVSFFSHGAVSYADDKSNLGYTVSTVQPNTQIDTSKSYFHIKTKPGESQELEVRVKSTKKEEVKIKIYALDAITSNSGTIEYSADKQLMDETLKEPISSSVQIDTPEITVSNFEEKKVIVKVVPPKNPYEGVKMGVVVFQLDQGESKGNGVANEFAYRIGLITSESGEEFNNSQTLNMVEAKASLVRGKKMVLASLQNPEPRVIDNLNIIATMTNKETGELVKKKNVSGLRLAPNSKFDFEMDWGIEALPSGSYTLKLEATNDIQEWILSKDFVISNEQAKKINEESAFNIITPMWIKLVTVFLGIVYSVCTGMILIRRKGMEQKWKRLMIKKRKKKGARKTKKKLRE